jgi:hypothetical protein
MSKKVIALSAVVGAAAALVTCLIFFLFVYIPSQSRNVDPTPSPTKYSAPTPADEIPNPEVKASDVKSISINTVCKGFFAPGNKCAKSYNEYFGNDDGIASPSSPCTIKMTFDRDGRATRSIEISRWDKTAKEKRPVEKTDSTGEVSADQFQALAQAIVTNEAFRSWREGTMITVSNCSITVVHSGGTKSVMSNIDEKTTVYLQMIDAIKKLESQIKWKDES